MWPETRGHPESTLRWTLTSTYELARQLTAKGFKVSAELVRRLLHQMGYSLQAPSKRIEGSSHPDRNAQFEYLDGVVADRLTAGEPVISVDTKKKELIGRYANGGKDWRPAKDPERVNVHDYADRALGEYAKAFPYGIYDIGNDKVGCRWGSGCRNRGRGPANSRGRRSGRHDALSSSALAPPRTPGRSTGCSGTGLFSLLRCAASSGVRCRRGSGKGPTPSEDATQW